MAILRDLPGVEITVEVDGKPLQEYDDPYANKNSDELELLVAATKETNPVATNVKHIPHVVKYIEAVSGKRFAFRFKKQAGFLRGCHHLGLEFSNDGRRTNFVHQARGGRDYLIKSHRSGGPSTDYWTHYYKFGDLKATSNDGYSKTALDKIMHKAKHYGSLLVRVYRMNYSGSKEKELCPVYRLSSTTNEVPEKAPAPAPMLKNNYYDPLQRPMAVFEFRYRSQEGLIQEGIIPRPTPVDDMGEQELREFARQFWKEDSFQSEIKEERVKQEGDDGASSSRKRIATAGLQTPAKRYKETVRVDGKVEVDLDSTLDNGDAESNGHKENRRVEVDLTD
ncbi:hypothetical protein BJ170DRAFT_695414 [Xylariales sp. AK1849]|nr:hypothetical protein BJ170DRAFT_695414 [Xylariales sp. AK1849]